MLEITPTLLLKAYANGYFPMAETAESNELYWFDPPQRGILPLDAFHVSRRLRRTLRRRPFTVRYDTAFEEVLDGCAQPTADRPRTWINDEIRSLYTGLHRIGYAHSVECWQPGEGREELVGGLYGVALHGAFFGESMFSRVTDASKVALVHLVTVLRQGGFVLLDTQFTTEHLRRFGGIEIPKPIYHQMLASALTVDARWQPDTIGPALEALVAGGD